MLQHEASRGGSSLPVLAVVIDTQGQLGPAGRAVGFAMPLCEGSLASFIDR